MKIRYLGHSCFELVFSGVRFVTDPYDGIGIRLPRIAADAVTISHGHFDHNFVQGVDAPLVLDREGEYSVGGVCVTAKSCYHDEAKGAKRGKNLIFRFSAEGITVCHLGDLGEKLSPALIEKIVPADVLLIPVGGTYTIDAAAAKEYAEAVAPAVLIPMHYKAKGIDLDIAPVDGFLGQFGRGKVEKCGCEVTVEKSALRNGETKIIVMERFENDD